MKVLAILALSFLIIIASFCLFAFSMCAVNGSPGDSSVGERVGYATAAIVTLAGIVGLAKLIRKINRSIGL